MTGAEYERRVKKLAKVEKVRSFLDPSKGKGSHGRLYFGDKYTTLKDRKKEIGEGLFRKMCADLGIDPCKL
jgi:mRNA interferase HicA